MFACDAVDLDFLNTAPKRLHAAVKVGRPPSKVFAAFAHDPANRGEFFPGFDRTGTYRPHPHFTLGLRTIASRTAATALCCALPSAASRDLPSNWQPLCCSAVWLSC
jgi:hypothetical protein